MAQPRSPILVGFALLLALAAGVAAVVATGPGSRLHRPVLPAPVDPAPTTVERPATVVPDDSGIPGVVAYDSQGWPAGRGTPGPDSLPHNHARGPVAYSVTPPIGGDHSARWMNCGVYSQPVPSERAVHNLEHGAVWITYRPDLPAAD